MNQGETHNSIGSVHGGVAVNAGRVGSVTVHHHAAGPGPARPPADPWPERAGRSSVWDRVREGSDPGPFREAAVDAASRLVPLRDAAEERLADDPWLDPGVPLRFLRRVEELLGEPGPGHDLDLYPAEAALLVLAPFVFRVHELNRAAGLAEVGPGSLERVAGADAARTSFEEFAEGYGTLVKRARRHPDHGAGIGWWLFHRWSLRAENVPGEAALRELLDLVREPGEDLAGALDPARLGQVFHGLRRGPGVCNPEYLGLLRADDRVRGRGSQRVREQRLVLVLALAFGTALEAASLPEVVAEHLGVPHAVDLGRLLETVEGAHWGGPEDLPVLEAECHHEAVIEALREYVGRVDELLHEIHRSVRKSVNQPVPELPVRLSADGVRPAEGVFDGWSRFRIDERRARELLTGVQLYKNRDLAVRELYQNALDACRYRRARTEYLDRTSAGSYAYEGRIDFTQGVDGDGRRYVDCSDDGVGMGEAELRGVFSHAGARFAEQPDYLMEREKWEALDPPVRLYPNSRFGIGVLSYFMLADDIRVTTCRMGADGGPGPVLEASIHGPGHLFRIRRVAERGTAPGTTVRLYLSAEAVRDGDWSCVEVLRRLLGIAEFHTTAEDGRRGHEWQAGEFVAPGVEEGADDGIRAEGELAPWDAAPEGAGVIWCNDGGALLVDGLFVRPAVRRGYFSPSGCGFFGVVVNLSGPLAPEQLSADRGEVLSDISGVVGALLEEASRDLFASNASLPDYSWLCSVAGANPALADLLVASAVERGAGIPLKEGTLSPADVGVLPADRGLALIDTDRKHRKTDEGADSKWMHVSGSVPAHILLWRLLAHRDERVSGELLDLAPELSEVGPLLLPCPSDQLLLVRTDADRRMAWSEPKADALFTVARTLEIGPSEVVARMEALGLLGEEAALLRAVADDRGLGRVLCVSILEGRLRSVSPVALAWMARRSGVSVAEVVRAFRTGGHGLDESLVRIADGPLARALLDAYAVTSSSSPPWVSGPVPPGAVVSVALSLSVPVEEVERRISDLGMRVVAGAAPRRADPWLLTLLSVKGDGAGPWIACGQTVPPGNILCEALETGVEPLEIIEKVARAGLPVPGRFPDDAGEDDMDLLFDEEGRALIPSAGLRYYDLYDIQEVSPLGMAETVDRLRAFGFDIGLRFPADISPLEETLSTGLSLLSWGDIGVNDPLPLVRVLAAAQEEVESLERVLAALTRLGMRTSYTELPKGLRFSDVARLVSGNFEETPLEVSFAELVEAGRRMRAPVTRVAEWYRQLGITVPDIAETIREALPLIPLWEAREP
ncbi:hypothetical protein ACIRPH_20490 [Nocardiopsis sp. NPDC101807]|uniref:wHTH domain-containing protein n=1 Tax=Nocardiopsis sp. NPDC101807 TaxID=3364339 RepID=UPI00382E54F9